MTLLTVAIAIGPPVIFLVALYCWARQRGFKRTFSDNIFTNPEAWARSLVGTAARYRLMQVLAASNAAALLSFIYSLYITTRHGKPSELLFVPITLFTLISAVHFPLCYFRALRHFVSHRDASV